MLQFSFIYPVDKIELLWQIISPLHCKVPTWFNLGINSSKEWKNKIGDLFQRICTQLNKTVLLKYITLHRYCTDYASPGTSTLCKHF